MIFLNLFNSLFINDVFILCIGTIFVRSIMFPLVIISQRNSAKMSNHLPEMQAIQLKMS